MHNTRYFSVLKLTYTDGVYTVFQNTTNCMFWNNLSWIWSSVSIAQSSV